MITHEAPHGIDWLMPFRLAMTLGLVVTILPIGLAIIVWQGIQIKRREKR